MADDDQIDAVEEDQKKDRQQAAAARALEDTGEEAESTKLDVEKVIIMYSTILMLLAV